MFSSQGKLYFCSRFQQLSPVGNTADVFYNEEVMMTCFLYLLFIYQDGEALEAGTKKFEDLEFQQLERESSLEEERETMSQQLLQERAEYHGSVAKRKVRRLSFSHYIPLRFW